MNTIRLRERLQRYARESWILKDPFIGAMITMLGIVYIAVGAFLILGSTFFIHSHGLAPALIVISAAGLIVCFGVLNVRFGRFVLQNWRITRENRNRV